MCAGTHGPPLKPERLDELLHPADEPMRLLALGADAAAALDAGAEGPVEDEEGEEGGGEEAGAAEEEEAQLGVLALAAVGGVEEPDGGVDADAEAAVVRGGGGVGGVGVGVGGAGGVGSVEAVDDGDVGEGAGLPGWTKHL